jgi:hypothetical protein
MSAEPIRRTNPFDPRQVEDMDAAAAKIQARSRRREPQNTIVRELSTFIRTVMEVAEARALREAALVLLPDERVAPALRDRLHHMLSVAVATLCDSASLNPAGDEIAATSDLVQSAQAAVASVERASSRELADAHAYFLAPPWRDEVAQEQRELADLSFGVARFMIECASECLV